jgi:hypothetical protein
MFRVGALGCCGMALGLTKRLIKFSFLVGGGDLVIPAHS